MKRSAWFRRAANQEQRKDIARLARRAIRDTERSTLNSSEPEAIQVVHWPSGNANSPISISASAPAQASTTTCSALRRSPTSTCPTRTIPVLVTPEVQEGVYIPVSMSAKYQVNALEHEGFFGSYRFGGRFYQDEALKNGDEFLQEIAFGSEFRKRDENREKRASTARSRSRSTMRATTTPTMVGNVHHQRRQTSPIACPTCATDPSSGHASAGAS